MTPLIVRPMMCSRNWREPVDLGMANLLRVFPKTPSFHHAVFSKPEKKKSLDQRRDFRTPNRAIRPLRPAASEA
jgi:hypothetical protein